MNKPEFVKIGEIKFKINTDFRVAIECNHIALDKSIGEYEKSLAIIYKLFGDKGLDYQENYEKLLQLGQIYLNLGKELSENKEEPDMDFEQDMDYIEASFMSDYKIDITNTKMHWWTFYNLINGLSNSELGSCCVLNRIRNLRTFDTSKIKDRKEKEKILKAKKEVALKKEKTSIVLTKEQEDSIRELDKLMRGE